MSTKAKTARGLGTTLVAIALVAGSAHNATAHKDHSEHSTKDTTNTAVSSKPAKKGIKGKVKVLNNTICPVTHDRVDAMGDTRSVVYKGCKIGLCCDYCEKKFSSNPDKYLAEARANSAAR